MNTIHHLTASMLLYPFPKTSLKRRYVENLGFLIFMTVIATLLMLA